MIPGKRGFVSCLPGICKTERTYCVQKQKPDEVPISPEIYRGIQPFFGHQNREPFCEPSNSSTSVLHPVSHFPLSLKSYHSAKMYHKNFPDSINSKDPLARRTKKLTSAATLGLLLALLPCIVGCL